MTAGEQIAVLAAGTATFVFAPMAHIFARRVTAVAVEPLRLRSVPVVGLVLLAILVAGNIALSFGRGTSAETSDRVDTVNSYVLHNLRL